MKNSYFCFRTNLLAALFGVSVFSGSDTVVADTVDIPISLSSSIVTPASAVRNALKTICPSLSGSSNTESLQLVQVCEGLESNSSTPLEVSTAMEQMSGRAITTLINYTARMPMAGDFGRTSIFSYNRVFNIRKAVNKKEESFQYSPFYLEQSNELDFSQFKTFFRGINFYSALNASSYDQNRTLSDANFTGRSLGLIVGADTLLFENVEVGLAIDFARGEYDVLGNSELNTSRFNLVTYGSYSFNDQWFLEGVLTSGSVDYELTRRINFQLDGLIYQEAAISTSKGKQINASLGSGYEFNFNKGISIIAWTDLNAVKTTVGQFRESEGNGFSLDVSSIDIYVGKWRAGFDAAMPIYQPWGIILPQLSLQLVNEFYNNGRPVNSPLVHDPSNTDIRFVSDNRDAFYTDITAGASFIMQKNVSMFLSVRKIFLLDEFSQWNSAAGFRAEF